MAKRNKMIHFSGRTHPIKGVIAAIIGIIGIIGFIILSILSAVDRGQGGFILGILGFVLLGGSIYGFVLSYKSMKEKDIFYLFPLLGMATNGVMLVILFVLYVVGLII